MCLLAPMTVTIFRIEWKLSVDFVCDLTAVAACAPLNRAKLVVRADLVWRTVFVAGVFFSHGGFVERWRMTELSSQDETARFEEAGGPRD